jgi:hypothetical protein
VGEPQRCYGKGKKELIIALAATGRPDRSLISTSTEQPRHPYAVFFIRKNGVANGGLKDVLTYTPA